jgi:hypothetical protein
MMTASADGRRRRGYYHNRTFVRKRHADDSDSLHTAGAIEAADFIDERWDDGDSFTAYLPDTAADGCELMVVRLTSRAGIW